MIKKTFVPVFWSFGALLFAVPQSAFSQGTKATPSPAEASKVAPSRQSMAEMHTKMAAMHTKMAGCLASDKPVADCQKSMMQECTSGLGGNCPMMHGNGMMGGHGMEMMNGGMGSMMNSNSGAGDPAPKQPTK